MENQNTSRFLIRGKLQIVFWAIAIIIGILLVVILLRDSSVVVRNQSGYQAIFLDNDQVYFGKLRALNREFVSLSDIYYLRAGTVQQGVGGDGDLSSGRQVDLVKLGAELHAPDDEMIIQKDHIIFYEDIREDGEIMKLIREHKAR